MKLISIATIALLITLLAMAGNGEAYKQCEKKHSKQVCINILR